MTRRTEVVVIALAVVLATVAVWGWLSWAAHRDETGMTSVAAPEEISDSSRRFDPSPPYKRSAPYNLPEDKGWPADWPTRHEIGLIAWGQHLDHLEVDASSMAIERQPSGEIVVTNVPEAPVETVPGSELEALICSYDWDCPTAIAVAHCESTMNPAAISPGGDMGLMQVNPVHRGRVAAMGYEWGQLLDPAVNLEVAWSIYVDAGHTWRPWTCARGNR